MPKFLSTPSEKTHVQHEWISPVPIKRESIMVMKNFSQFQPCAVRLCLILLLILAGLSGCSVKATIKTSSDGTTNFLSSTTGKSWWTENGLVKRSEQAKAFVAINYDTLLQEMAQGHGDYLQAFGTMLGVSSHQQVSFQRMTQAQYPFLAARPVPEGNEQITRFINHVRQVWVRSTAQAL
jgi:hypothetical protein